MWSATYSITYTKYHRCIDNATSVAQETQNTVKVKALNELSKRMKFYALVSAHQPNATYKLIQPVDDNCRSYKSTAHPKIYNTFIFSKVCLHEPAHENRLESAGN